MGHPIKSSYPAGAVHNTSNKTRESQKHNNSDNSKLHNSTNCFSSSHFLPLPSLRSFLHSVRSLKTTSNPWSQESSFFLHGSHNNSTRFLIFTVSGPFIQRIRSLKGSTSQVFCPRSPRAGRVSTSKKVEVVSSIDNVTSHKMEATHVRHWNLSNLGVACRKIKRSRLSSFFAANTPPEASGAAARPHLTRRRTTSLRSGNDTLKKRCPTFARVHTRDVNFRAVSAGTNRSA